MFALFNNEKMAQPFTDYLRSMLEAGGVTAYRLAKLTGMSEGHVSNLLKGRREFTDDVVERIAEALNIDPEEMKARRDVETLAENIERIRQYFPDVLGSPASIPPAERIQKGRDVLAQFEQKKQQPLRYRIVGEVGAGSPIENPEHGEQDEPC